MKFFALKTLMVSFTMCLAISSANAQKTGSVSGTILKKNNKQSLVGATINIVGTNLSAATDSNGRFRVLNIPVKTYNLIVSAVGFKTISLYNIVVNSGNENVYTVELEEDAAILAEVNITENKRSVIAASLETPLSVQRLTAEEIRSNPGGSFDISKVIQTLPGVGGGQQGGSFRNDIIIRGGASNENVFYLDGIEIPVINHFQTQGGSGGPQGILNTFFIEDVKLSSSAFDARYDNALSSVFQFKQKVGNANKFQGNVRASLIESAITLEGPLSKNKKTTFLASARKSYYQLLFKALNLPFLPDFWDFQTKITHKINDKLTLNFISIGAIDDFRFVPIDNVSPEKLYQISSSATIQQWNYTMGVSLRKSLDNGFWNLALSRTRFNNNLQKFEDNENPTPASQTLDFVSNETENKLRFDINEFKNGWKLSYGASTQLAEYDNNTFAVLKKEVRDTSNNIIQPGVNQNFSSPLNPFLRLGAFLQVSKRALNDRLGISGGVRTDINTFTKGGMNGLQTLSPRISFSYVLTPKWTANASTGIYYKLPVYTLLGYSNNNNVLVNQNAKYTRSTHYTSGFEFLPNDGLRFTLEGFYKQYGNVAVSLRDGISLANLGTDFTALGNEAVNTNGKGKAYGIEFFAQKKLTEKFFGILSFTYYRSLYSGIDNKLIASSWDNQQLLSITAGYKFSRNWELGLKFRYQGGAPYTPFDETASRLNYSSQGRGTLDFARLNTQRLGGFNSSDVRIDKKINLKKTTIDVFLDVTNWYVARNPAIPEYTWQRAADNRTFKTTDGLAIKADGSNAMPTNVKNDEPQVIPTIGVVFEF
ncbi:TonB-dependent receptor [Pedobacter sp. JCM 36344]|uniref:TonB-dependent receptor n=1 Tax=Pedobacter sp. JCM 36344 TaxID=3374280 RepID=UPI00397B6834